MSTSGTPPKHLSERQLQRYMNKNLLSLPDDILNQIASYLLPLPPPNPPTVTSLKHALSLAQTCQRFHSIVTSRLHTLDCITPSSYTSLTNRTPPHVSVQLERFIRSASKLLRDLRLPQGYVPSDSNYAVVRACTNLTHLSLPVSRYLDSAQAQAFFSGFGNLQSITLDLASPSVVIGLCQLPADLKHVSFTKLPASCISFTALSAFLIAKGASLTSLSVDLLCDDSYNLYNSETLSGVRQHPLMLPIRALPRLSSVLQRHVGNNELPVLRELHVSTAPDVPLRDRGTTHISSLESKIIFFKQAIKRARLQNTQPKGLNKLRMRVHSDGRHVCTAFMSNWIDREVVVEVSFPDVTLIFPRNEPDGRLVTQVKDIVLHVHGSFRPHTLTDVKFDVETLGFTDSSFSQSMNVLASKLLSFIEMVRGRTVRTLRIIYDIPQLSSFSSLKLFLERGANLLPALVTLELPAEVVLFSGCPGAWVDLERGTRYSIKILRLYGFRSGKVVVFDRTTSPFRFAVRRISLEGFDEKATWFLKGLPMFLRMLRKSFPKLELVYMEQAVVGPLVVMRKDIFQAMHAIDTYEESTCVDASTLRTEIMHWRSSSTLTTE